MKRLMLRKIKASPLGFLRFIGKSLRLELAARRASRPVAPSYGLRSGRPAWNSAGSSRAARTRARCRPLALGELDAAPAPRDGLLELPRFGVGRRDGVEDLGAILAAEVEGTLRRFDGRGAVAQRRLRGASRAGRRSG